MSLVVKVNGTAIADAIPPESVQSQHRAQSGDAGFGGFTIDDPDALVTTIGHNAVTVEETACSQPRLFTGYLTERDIGRSIDRGMVAGADARAHDVTMVDLNALFSFRTLTYSAVKRPDETMAARLTWLLGHWSLASFIEDTGYVTYPTSPMDAADYTGATAAAVLDDMVSRVAGLYTYFAFWDADAQAVGLYFGPEGTGIGESTLYISNDLADIDGTTTFAPDAEAKLARTPEEVYSEVIVEYSHGTKRIYRSRPATVTAYGIARGTTIQRPYTGRATTAQAQADTWLSQHSVERDTITTSILVPPESAGLAIAGQRINVKFTHLDDYADWTSMRIVTSDVQPVDDTATLYRIALVLQTPVAGSAPPSLCDGTVNALAGLVAYRGDTDVPALFGAQEDGQEIIDPDKATDGFAGQTSVTGTIAYYDAGAYINYPTFVREFRFILPQTSRVRKVTVEASHNGAGIADVPDRGWTFYMKVGGGTYWAAQCATINDFDVWGSGQYGDLQEDYVATWDFGEYIETDTITFGMQSDGAYSEDYVPELDLFEIWACLAETDEEEDLGATPGSTVLSTSDPTVNDDGDAGYTVGQLWQNTTTGAWYILTDATAGAAVWQSISSPPMALDDLTDVNATSPAEGAVLAWDDGASEWAIVYPLVGQFVVVVDGGGGAITGTPFVDLVAPSAGELTGWTILAYPSGSAEFSVWSDTYSNFPPTVDDSIVAAAPPTLTTAVKATDSTLTGWTKTFAAGDTFRVTLASSSTVERLTLVLSYTKG